MKITAFTENFYCVPIFAKAIYIWETFSKFQEKSFTLPEISAKDDQPGDFVTKVERINNQSDLTWMTSFAGPSYLTIRFSVYIILI